MEIPARLESVLKEDSPLHAAVSLALKRFTPWVDQKRLIFFDEYTDHGPAHIETVLRSASGLVAAAAWGTLDESSLVGSAARTPSLEAAIGARDAGALAYLVKPFQKSELIPAVEVALGRFQEMKALADENLSLADQLETRKVVDRAKGKLMDNHDMTEADAFRFLQKTAMDTRNTLKQVAQDVIEGSLHP